MALRPDFRSNPDTANSHALFHSVQHESIKSTCYGLENSFNIRHSPRGGSVCMLTRWHAVLVAGRSLMYGISTTLSNNI